MIRRASLFCLLLTTVTTTSHFPSTAPLPAAVNDFYDDDDYRIPTGEELDVQTAESGNVFQSIWSNPCGEGLQANVGSKDSTAPTIAEALQFPLLEVKIALRHSHQLLEELAKTALRESLPEALHSCSHIRYDWLSVDDIRQHKEIGKNLSQESLSKLQWDKVLNHSYTSLQKVAMVMELVFQNPAVYRSDYFNQYRQNELRLRMVLCSMQTAMLDLGLLQTSDIRREATAQEFHVLERFSTGNLRDFIILREYTNVLEYALQILDHFQN